ncbi:MAG: glycosyltransferase family 39 protein [Actinomycetota bacterium]|nr:glycosyltransferase family 39 protein [Actinomycetota bacterium]
MSISTTLPEGSEEDERYPQGSAPTSAYRGGTPRRTRTLGAALSSVVRFSVAGPAALELRQRLQVRATSSRRPRVASKPAFFAVAVFTVVGFVLRAAATRGIWLDEATSIFEARMRYGQMLSYLYRADVHPPLYFTILWLTIRLAHSDALFLVRLPSVIFGAAIVPMAYIAGRDLFDRRTGVVASLFSALSPIMVWYSQDVRMYSLFMLLGLVALWSQVMAYRTGKSRYWAVWALSSATLAWTQYFGLFEVFSQQVAFAWVAWRDRHGARHGQFIRKWLLWSGVAAALALPVLPFAYHQFLVNQQTGKGFTTAPSQPGTTPLGASKQYGLYAILANMIWAAWGYQPSRTMTELGALWPLIMLVGFLALGRKPREETRFLGVAIAGPILLMVGVAYFKHFLLDVRYVSGTIPLIALLGARMVSGITRRTGATYLASGLVGVSLAGALANQQLNLPKSQHYAFRQALARVAGTYRPGDVILYAPGGLNHVIKYYMPSARTEPLTPKTARNAGGRNTGGHYTFVVISKRLVPTVGSYRTDMASLIAVEREGLVRSQFSVPNVHVWEVSIGSKIVKKPVPLTGNGGPSTPRSEEEEREAPGTSAETTPQGSSSVSGATPGTPPATGVAPKSAHPPVSRRAGLPAGTPGSPIPVAGPAIGSGLASSATAAAPDAAAANDTSVSGQANQ